ncbi:DUF2207 family protein [Streptomyces sp. NPDC006739]|uniref:DUF2207 family protein n=1 Tax=Streptomyces sp. NPDC006739 TaxID=3364763 RepID=UPI0036C4DE3B
MKKEIGAYDAPRARIPAPVYDELPAAVVNLLIGGGEVTPKAIETTALELVGRGRLRAERKSDGTLTVRLDPEPRDHRPLRPFEELLLERVRHRCRFHVDRVPIAALGPGDGDEYWVWWRGFQQGVRDEAMALGLIRPPRRKWATWLSGGGVAIEVWLGMLSIAALIGKGVFHVVLALSIPGILLPFIFSDRFPGRSGRRLTVEGRRAATWWRRSPDAAEHRPPARQVGAKGPQSALPVRESRRIWSSYGGSWHVVDTAPLDRPRWGHIWQIVLLALAGCTTTAALALPATRVPHGAALAVGPALLGVLGWALWLPARRRIQAVPTELTFRGAVICRFDYVTQGGEPPTATTHYCCSVEDPASGKAWSFEVDTWDRSLFSRETNPTLADRFLVGDVVEVHCAPRRRVVYRMTVVEAVPR